MIKSLKSTASFVNKELMRIHRSGAKGISKGGPSSSQAYLNSLTNGNAQAAWGIRRGFQQPAPCIANHMSIHLYALTRARRSYDVNMRHDAKF